MDIELVDLPGDEAFGGITAAPRLRPALVEAGEHGRLVPRLRAIAQAKQPSSALIAATKTRAQAGHSSSERAVADAMADLAVTGSTSYARSRAAPPRLDEVARRAATELDLPSDDAIVLRHARRAIYRAEWVAEYLSRGHSARARMRRDDDEMEAWASAGIAVSGEDDPAHRPVNVAMTPLVQGRIVVGKVPTTRGPRLSVDTRYAVAGPLDGSTEVVLFIHGHTSRIEEVDGVIRELRRIRDENGRPRYSAIVCDLPSCGYAARIEHTRIAKSTADGVPVLDFLCRFLDIFVTSLMRQHPGFEEVALVAGGSLGGNLSLLLGERRRPWLRRLACWSPGSVWTRSGLVSGLGGGATRGRMREAERAESRREYFQQVFIDEVPLTGRTQPQHWYFDEWAGNDAAIAATDDDRRELYGKEMRRMHWRLAAEQLGFSHFERDVYKRIQVPALLMAGTEDNFPMSEQRAMIVHLAGLMKAASKRGWCRLPTRTGHSIHAERPRWLAKTLDAFIRAH